MTWRFTIINNAIDTVIDEPVGWDAMTKVIQRDPDWHGVFFNFSENDLQFIEKAYWILYEEYLLNGVDGDAGLKIESKCDDCVNYSLFYNGKFDFEQYKRVCGEDCYISIGLQATDAETLIKNRLETAVDLTSNKAYDGTTVLTDYDGINKEIEVPGKSLLIQSRAENAGGLVSENLRDSTEWHITDGGSGMLAQIIPGFTTTVRTDLADTFFRTDIGLLSGGFNNRPSTGQFPMVDVQKFSSLLQCASSSASLKYRYKGHIDTVGGAPAARFKIFLLPKGSDPEDATAYSQLADHNLGASGNHYDFSNTLSITLNVGDKIFAYTFINLTSNAMDYTSYIVTEDPECFIDISLASLCDPSPAKAYLIHETGSRIIESITNNAFKLRSAYYGRTDSEPYAYAGDGCGSLRAVTNGLQLRRAVLQDNSQPKVFLSLKEYMESLNAVDCIGYGIEGSDVRVEPIKYFYSDEVVFVADGVNEIRTSVMTERIWNQFSFGYDKYETESTNGLDAIHTKRQYRTQIKNSNNKLEKVSKMIADGYATEVTRRKFGTSEDWRYDQNIFILCLKRVASSYTVEQDNISGAANMFDPHTVINYAISPIRNAMRWFKWLVQGIRSYATTKILFNSGEGNYVAEGKLSTGCIIEDDVIAENDPIEQASFADADDATPFIEPEKDAFTFPMGLNEFVHVSANKYGKVQYRKDSTDKWKFGWIDSLKYIPEDGEAEFNLITCKEQ